MKQMLVKNKQNCQQKTKHIKNSCIKCRYIYITIFGQITHDVCIYICEATWQNKSYVGDQKKWVTYISLYATLLLSFCTKNYNSSTLISRVMGHLKTPNMLVIAITTFKVDLRWLLKNGIYNTIFWISIEYFGR